MTNELHIQTLSLGPDESPYQPCVDLVFDGVRMATLYWDDEPTLGFDGDEFGQPDYDNSVIGPNEPAG